MTVFMASRMMGMRMRMVSMFSRGSNAISRLDAAHKGTSTLFYLERVFRFKELISNTPSFLKIEEKNGDKDRVQNNRHVKVREKLKRQPHYRSKEKTEKRVHALAVDRPRFLRPLNRNKSGDDKKDYHPRFPPVNGVNRVAEHVPFKVADIHSLELFALSKPPTLYLGAKDARREISRP